MVEPSTECPAWQPRCRGRSVACVGLVLSLGSLSHYRSRRRISGVAGSDDWTGLGLGHPIARPGESCLAHRHNDSGPLDHDGADRRTNGDDALSRSDRTRLGGFLDHIFLWVLQASPSASSPLHRPMQPQPIHLRRNQRRSRRNK